MSSAPAPPFGLRLAVLLMAVSLTAGLLMAVLFTAMPVRAQERVIYRSLPPGIPQSPAKPLESGAAATLEETPFDIRGVERLRIVSPEPAVRVVLRFRPTAGDGGTATLTVIVDSRPDRREYLYREDSMVLRAGRLTPRLRFRVDDGVETELSGELGPVDRIVVQDDAGAELRLIREGPLLTLEVVPPAFGGVPTHDPQPEYLRQPLYFLDYQLFVSGYTDNVYGEAWLFDIIGGRLSYFFKDTESLILGQAVLRQPVLHGGNSELWLEGGAAINQLTPENSADQESADISYTLGATYHWRWGDWGVAGHANFIRDSPLLLLQGGWQWLDWFAAVIHWQSFEGFSGFGAGGAIRF